MDTLIRKIDFLTEQLSKCKKEIKALKSTKTTSCNECNAFRKAVGSTSVNHKHKKRRMNRATTPNNFFNLDF